MASLFAPHLATPAHRTQPAALQRRCSHAMGRLAMLDILRRRGRHWGLLAQYEEGRLTR